MNETELFLALMERCPNAWERKEKEIRADERAKTIKEVLNELEELKQNFKNHGNIHEAIAVNISIKRINEKLSEVHK